MMKKCWIICSLLFSVPSYAISHAWTGFYALGGIGGSNTQFDATHLFSAQLPAISTTIEQQNITELHDNAVSGALALGYQYTFSNHFLLGLEARAELQNSDINAIDVSHIYTASIGLDVTQTLKTNLSNNLTLLVKSGYVLGDDTLFYLLIGPSWGQTRTELNAQFAATAVSAAASGQQKETGYQFGWMGGLGIAQSFSKNWTLGLEYTYSQYHNIDTPELHIPFTSTGGDGTVINTGHLDATDNTLLLMLSYTFG